MDDIIVSKIDSNIDPFLEDLPPPEIGSKSFDFCLFLYQRNTLIMCKDDVHGENLVLNDPFVEENTHPLING